MNFEHLKGTCQIKDNPLKKIKNSEYYSYMCLYENVDLYSQLSVSAY